MTDHPMTDEELAELRKRLDDEPSYLRNMRTEVRALLARHDVMVASLDYSQAIGQSQETIVRLVGQRDRLLDVLRVCRKAFETAPGSAARAVWEEEAVEAVRAALGGMSDD